MNQIQIIKYPDTNKPYAVIYKPAGLASAPLNNSDNENALNQAIKLIPELQQVKGRKAIEHGLIHRLDTATSGLMLIAQSQKCYDELIKLQQENKITKSYYAICNILTNQIQDAEGFPEQHFDLNKKNFEITSYFRAWGPGRKEVRPVTKESGMAALKKLEKPVLYSTNINILEIDSEQKRAKVLCKITNGYRHQVRCHLAWMGFPIVGDKLYNANYQNVGGKDEALIKFSATKLEFTYNGKVFKFSV